MPGSAADQAYVRGAEGGTRKSTEQLLLIKPLRRKVSAGRWLMINTSIMKEALIQLWRAHDACYKSQGPSFLEDTQDRQICHVLLRLARAALGCSSNNMWFGSSVQFICATVRGGTAK
ncbi:uncharacterized [Tachysurus ichikawai]